MKYVFLLVYIMCYWSSYSQKDSIKTILQAVEQDQLFSSALFPGEPTVYYYHFYNGVQMVEVDNYNYSLAQGRHEDMIHPRGGSSYMDALNRPAKNTYIFRNKSGKILASYNLSFYKLSKLRPPNKVKTISHKSHLTMPNTKGLSRLNQKLTRVLNYGYAYRFYTPDNKMGLIDTLGNIVIEPIQKKIFFYGDSYMAHNGEYWVVYDTEFKPVINRSYRRLERLAQNRYLACNEKCGFIDKKGNIIKPFKYESINFFDSNPNRLFVYIKDKKYGLMNYDLKEVSPAKYKWIHYFKEGGFYAPDSTGLIAIINEEGKEITPFKYSSQKLKRMTNGYYQVSQRVITKDRRLHYKIGLLDSTGKEVGAMKYESIAAFIGDNAIVQLNNKYGLINKKGQEITPLIYDNIANAKREYIVVKIGAHFGLIRNDGKKIIPPIYKQISCMHKELILVRNDERKLGFINFKNEVVLPFIYTNASCFEDGIARIWQDKKAGFINKKGKEVTGFKYDQVYTFKNGLGLVKKNNLYGCVDREGNELVAPKYKNIRYQSSGNILFYTGNKKKLCKVRE